MRCRIPKLSRGVLPLKQNMSVSSLRVFGFKDTIKNMKTLVAVTSEL